MLEVLVRDLALDLISGPVRYPNSTTRRTLAEAFWDLQNIYRNNAPGSVGHKQLPRSLASGPKAGASQVDRMKVHEEVFFGLLDIFYGSPELDPNTSIVLQNKAVRLSAAQNMAAKLTSAQQLLSKEIARLEALK